MNWNNVFLNSYSSFVSLVREDLFLAAHGSRNCMNTITQGRNLSRAQNKLLKAFSISIVFLFMCRLDVF